MTGFHCPHGIFLDDISTHEQFASWFIATEWKQFSTIYTLCFSALVVFHVMRYINVRYLLTYFTGVCVA